MEECQLEFNSETASSVLKLVFWIPKPKWYRRSGGLWSQIFFQMGSLGFSFSFLTTEKWFLEPQKSACQPFLSVSTGDFSCDEPAHSVDETFCEKNLPKALGHSICTVLKSWGAVPTLSECRSSLETFEKAFSPAPIRNMLTRIDNIHIDQTQGQ